MNMSVLIFFVHFIMTFWLLFLDAVSNPEEFVRPLAGSFTDGDKFSTGNTLPLIGRSQITPPYLTLTHSFLTLLGRPWGFNHWSPQTKEANRFSGSWWFKGSDHVFTWLRCTHQPSPWIGSRYFYHIYFTLSTIILVQVTGATLYLLPY